MKIQLRQILYDIRRQKVVTWVSFIATALSIFLVMVVVITQMVLRVPFAPESCRDRLLLGVYLHAQNIGDPNNNMSSSLSHRSARLLYDDLEGVERISYFTYFSDNLEVKGPGVESIEASTRKVDAEFFNIFDHTLLHGRYFTPEEADALMPLAIITESTARKVLGTDNPVGTKITVDQTTYTVIGIIADHSSLATTAYADVFLPTGANDASTQWGNEFFGHIGAALLIKKGVDPNSVRDQVKARYALLATEMKPEGIEPIYHQAPYDQETIACGLYGSNQDPDNSGNHKLYAIIIGILLLIPALNLSSMLHSRLQRRVSELGVRRAFGCTRGRIIRDIISENLIVTIAGGILGIFLGICYATFSTSLYENMETMGRTVTPPLSAVLDWRIIAIALAVCLVLNILSASVPAWQASRLNPVNAINRK